MALIHTCYGSGCPNERWDGECKYGGAVRKCPVEMSEEELEDDDFWREYWEDIKNAEARGE